MFHTYVVFFDVRAPDAVIPYVIENTYGFRYPEELQVYWLSNRLPIDNNQSGMASNIFKSLSGLLIGVP